MEAKSAFYVEEGDPIEPPEETTEIICVIDRSGSMSTIRDESITGFNKFLEEQSKLLGNVLITLALFNEDYDVLYDGVNLKDATYLSRENYVPGGMTALFDAIGKTITDVSARHEKMETPPDKVIVCIVTDGQENSSKEFKTKQKVVELVSKTQSEKGWEFVYVGVGIDAMGSDEVGISANRAASYGHSVGGVAQTYDSLSKATMNYRQSGDIGYWKNTYPDSD